MKTLSSSSSMISQSISTTKWLSLLAFIIQNSLLIIGLRYDAYYTEIGGDNAAYISTTVVLFTEHLKLLLSIAMFFIFDCHGSLIKFAELMIQGFVSDDTATDAVKLCVPALLYTIQNNLQYTIESSPIFLVVYQLKVITTAIFYSTLLGRRISMREWFAIILLAIGVGMVQSSQREFHANHASNMIGIISVVFACLTSGLAGVYFEKIMKSSKSSIWVINIQLSTLSSVLTMIVCLSRDTTQIIERGFTAGYNTYIIVVICLQALTGLAVALVVRYADNVHKGFASALAIVMSGLFEARLFPNSFDINVVFLSGSLLVIVSSIIFVLVSRRDPTITHNQPVLDVDGEEEIEKQ